MGCISLHPAKFRLDAPKLFLPLCFKLLEHCQEQLEFLREHDCDEIQGYWLSQPLSEPHCRSFITSWHQTRRNAADAPIAPAY